MTANDNELAEFYELSADRRVRCSVKDIFSDNKLGPADTKLLKKALVVKEIGHTAIAKWLKDRGIQISDHTVGRHRREQCHCYEAKK